MEKKLNKIKASAETVQLLKRGKINLIGVIDRISDLEIDFTMWKGDKPEWIKMDKNSSFDNPYHCVTGQRTETILIKDIISIYSLSNEDLLN